MIDADLVDGRFLLRVQVDDGLLVRLLADTCGGFHVRPDLGGAVPYAALPPGEEGEGVRLVLDPEMPEGHEVARLLPVQLPDVDGVLGAWWFVDRTWAFDYLEGRLELVQGYGGEGVADLFLPRWPDGRPLLPYARVITEIDDQELDLIFDTGATTQLSEQAHAVLGGPRIRASSFIAKSVVQRWRNRHPDWPFVERASIVGDSAMIEVPRVYLGGRDLGPTWFEERPDANFLEVMSQWTDRPVVGALGASAYGHLRVVVDYTRGRVGLE